MMILDSLRPGRRTACRGDEERIRQCRARCENFRLLLSANAEALDAMADMNDSLIGERPFGMTQVRSHCVKAASGVSRMIDRLCRMAPGRHDALKDVFNRIVLEINEIVKPVEGPIHGPLCVPLSRARRQMAGDIGPKMAMLGEARHLLGVTVPQGFVITAAAFRRFLLQSGLRDEIDRMIQVAEAEELDALFALESRISRLIAEAPFPDGLEEAVAEELERMNSDGSLRLAVRSSAVGEDLPGISFAGQYRTVLNVVPSEVLEAYREVVASMYSVSAMTYRLNRGIGGEELAMCVGCMRMVPARAGGVAYSVDPMDATGRTLSVSAVPGLPVGVVDGNASPDVWSLDRDSLEIVSGSVPEKTWKYGQAEGGGLERVPVNGHGSASVLGPEELDRLARLVLRLESEFDGPQDVEWAVAEDGGLILLQCRPLDREEDAFVAPRGDAQHLLLSGGIPASPGVGAGRPYVVDKDADMLGFPDCAVLVARNARPRLAAILPKAAAFVAENGSATGHLANVAREFSIPAVVGLKGAVDMLAGVETVTVSGTHGEIYSGRRSEMFPDSVCRLSVMEGTPVMEKLQKVVPLVTPLNLLHADGPEFAPEHCRTLHDLTRYCHEMGVREMFRGNGDMPLGRRLVAERTMQYWIVDLGEGISRDADPESDTVDLEHICSDPMLALWRGMTAMPWQGPPAPDARGLVDLFGQAAANPALSPELGSSMADRNYFMIDRHYCNLQSRYGFHFSTVEGHAGPDSGENYVFFQFKGGAAAQDRRELRAELIRRVLEPLGFVTEVRGDALYARMENEEASVVLDAMVVLGHLAVHTRQLDMAMTGPEVVDAYLKRIETEIETFLHPTGKPDSIPHPHPQGPGRSGADGEPESGEDSQ
ncbi:PEP/pyruvate-binding domain-containing protein [Pseudodesulfovibrio tunisiensis]|uniref:PEP/pyruvate-binding domain-containing protein n=1 Tax=Pseudodesulfovibrio tunisiensis TaxID=463192 RepID=UPI001FB4109D|nr:PEP/pyruvate-binding domain-containing protein [Pseudodesulfovibrio tunisiensis]